MSYYLTPEHFEIAEKNGISRDRLQQRVYQQNWSIERAIAQPMIKPKNIWKDWQELAEAHGVCMNTFYYRVRAGREPREAATAPSSKLSRIPSWVWEKAERNGISKKVLSSRVHGYKWDLERACTEPLNPRGGNRRKSRKDGGWK